MSKSKRRRRHEAELRRSRRMDTSGFQRVELPNGGRIWFPDPQRPNVWSLSKSSFRPTTYEQIDEIAHRIFGSNVYFCYQDNDEST